jgi:uncharacterized protein (DUF2147 family)
MYTCRLILGLPLAALTASGAAFAQSGPTGVWIDHTGRGGVEITECGGNLCGHLVWFKDAANKKKGCRTQIIGNARPVGKDVWDGGWIFDPDKNARYSVELKPIGADKLQVVGYAGSKLFSQTMIWKRAAPDLEKCDETKPEPTGAPAPSEPKAAPPAKTNGPPEPTKGKAAPAPSKETGCTEYLPQIGKSISVPCKR